MFIILSDSYQLPLAVGSLIALTQPTPHDRQPKRSAVDKTVVKSTNDPRANYGRIILNSVFRGMCSCTVHGTADSRVYTKLNGDTASFNR
jgi:hypothetical protein